MPNCFLCSGSLPRWVFQGPGIDIAGPAHSKVDSERSQGGPRVTAAERQRAQPQDLRADPHPAAHLSSGAEAPLWEKLDLGLRVGTGSPSLLGAAAAQNLAPPWSYRALGAHPGVRFPARTTAVTPSALEDLIPHTPSPSPRGGALLPQVSLCQPARGRGRSQGPLAPSVPDMHCLPSAPPHALERRDGHSDCPSHKIQPHTMH